MEQNNITHEQERVNLTEPKEHDPRSAELQSKSLADVAIEYLQPELSIMPIREDRHPVLKHWKHLETKRAEIAEVQSWPLKA